MGVLGRVLANIIDARHLGVGCVLKRHLSRLTAKEWFSFNVSGYGRIYMRTNDSDFDDVRGTLGLGEYDVNWPAEMLARATARYQAILDNDKKPIIIDCGAYIGVSSLRFAKMWPKAVVVSVEPDPGNLKMLRRNLDGRLNHVIVEAAIGSAPGSVTLANPSQSWAIQAQRAPEGIPIVTMDDAIAAAGPGEPFLCNIDIEGFEKDLFAANTGWVERFCMVFVEPHDWTKPGERLSGNFQRVMAAHSFEVMAHRGIICYLQV